MLGMFMFAGGKDVKAAYGDRASYSLEPWTFWQAGVTTDDWNRWELSAYESVEMRDNADKICAFSDSTPNMNPRIYDNSNWFKHPDPATHKRGGEVPVTVQGVSHGYVATIEKNGWSGKWLPDETEENNDPPKWGEVTSSPGETTEFVPYLIDNNPYTVRAWTKAYGLKKNRTYTWKFNAYIDDGAIRSREGSDTPGDNVDADDKYCKIVGKTASGTILFVRYIVITKKKQTYMFNFDMDSSNSALVVEMMYGAFLKTGPIIKHTECNFHGTIHIEDCDVIQGDLLKVEETTTTRKAGGGGGDDEEWLDEPEKITGVKVKSKAKKSAKLSWSREENSTKYQVNYALKKNFKDGKKRKTSKTGITIKGLKRKKTYYFRVRGMNDEYTGAWSAKKKCKIK